VKRGAGCAAVALTAGAGDRKVRTTTLKPDDEPVQIMTSNLVVSRRSSLRFYFDVASQ